MGHGRDVSEQALRLLDQLTTVLRGRNPGLLEVWPLTRYMACLDRYPELAPLEYRSREVQKACEAIKGVVGGSGLELYHRTLLLALIGRAARALPHRGLPEDVELLYEANFRRIMRDIETSMARPTLYMYPFSPFCKDLALCTLRLVPAGVEKVHASRLPRRMFVTAGLRGGLDALRFALPPQRGLGPYYQMHLHSQDVQAMRAFNPRGWAEFYLRIAELLRRNPGTKGVFGTAWFRDPALARVSPRLVYLRTMITDNGGRLFPLGRCGANGIRDATAKSATRRELYEKGEYTPMDYLVVWPRKELLAWADAGPELGSCPGENVRTPESERAGEE